MLSLILKSVGGTSLAVQWLGLGSFTPVGLDLIPGQGTKIPYATWHGPNNLKNKKIKIKKPIKLDTLMVDAQLIHFSKPRECTTPRVNP